MKSRTKRIGYGIILLWMFWPMIPVIVVAVIAGIWGCKSDEGSVHPCIVFGNDIGEVLYSISMIGLFGMGTFPSGILALIVFTVIVWLCKASGRAE